MKILYITAQTPWGKGETFILEEMLNMKYQGVNLLIIPRNPPKEIFHKEAIKLLENAVWLPLINLKMIIIFLVSILSKPCLWKILFSILRYSRSWRIMIKNLVVLPKGVFIANMIKNDNIDHIHAHWGSTTSTMAWIISELTGIPWSFTLHRWDIKENNMLSKKIKTAKFVRCISEHGKSELLEIIGRSYKEKVKVIHMGVKIPENTIRFQSTKKIFKIIVPANLIEVKGHQYLIDACLNLINQGITNFQCIFYGEGVLREKLESLIVERKLVDYIKMPGPIPHEKLIDMYKNREVDIVILPSITTYKGEHEGIPVSLMEAMAYGIPVISTNTGGIPELMSGGAGIIVEQRSPDQLAQAIIRIMKDTNFTRELSERGYQRVQSEFNIDKNVENLLEAIQKSRR